MDEFLRIMKAISDKNRIRIVKMLEVRNLCVCEITSILQISTSTVSSHLSILKEAGYITDFKNGKWVDYKLNKHSVNPSLHQILAMIPGWLNDDLQVINDRLNVETVNRNVLCGID